MISEDELWALESLGHFYLVRGRDEEARVLFESLSTLAPLRAYPWFGLGLLANRAEDPVTACQCFSAATERSDDQRFALALAETLLVLKSQVEAERLLHQLALTPTSCGRRAGAILRSLRR